MTKRKVYEDYLTAHLVVKSAKWVSDHISKDRRIALYGIDVAVSTGKNDGRVELSPCIPAMSPLCALIRKNPNATQFVWKNKKWKLAK